MMLLSKFRLRRAIIVLVAVVLGFCGWACRREATTKPRSAAAADTVPPADAKAGGVVLRRVGEREPRSEDAVSRVEPLRQGDSMLVSFPQPMATPADFDKPIANPPVTLTPALPLRFRWRSTTEAEVTVDGATAPATVYRLGLRADVRDLAGKPIEAPNWGFEWPAAPFRAWVTDEVDASRALSAQPSVGLAFSHPVAASEVARTVLWRDERGRGVGTEVQLHTSADPKGSTHFRIVPLAALEPGNSYELIVEQTRCALDGSRLPYVHAFPLGKTESLAVEWVRAHHQPEIGTFLDIRFNQPLDPARLEVNALRVSPNVVISSVTPQGPDLRVFGPFQSGVRYAIEIEPHAVSSRRGFGLARTAKWHATFGAKRAAVILPRSILTTPAQRDLKVEFTQVNTGPLRWTLARVPVERVIAVRARLDEYRQLDETKRDPRTGEFSLKPTELLVPALGLPVAAQGTFESVDGDHEVSRTISVARESIDGGVYLLEISGPAKDGRVAGNRALILANREFLVWKNGRDGLRARMFDVISGEPIAGAGVQVLERDGKLLASGATNAEGEFGGIDLGAQGIPELVLVRRGDALSAHFVEFTGHFPWYSAASETPAHRQWLFTDRGIYRPGESMRVKGIVRENAARKLTVPTAGLSVKWELIRLGAQEPVLAGETVLSLTGAWEAEIKLPDTLPLGHYDLRALGQMCAVKVDEFRAPAFAVEVRAIEGAPPGSSRVRVLSHYFHGAPNARALVRWRAVWSPHVPPAEEFERGRYLSVFDHYSPEHELRAPTWAQRAEDTQVESGGARAMSLDGTAVLDATGAVELSSVAPFAEMARVAAANVSWEVSVVAPDGQTVDAAGGEVQPLAPAQPAVGVFATANSGEVEVVATALDVEGNAAPDTRLKVTLYRVSEKTVRENLSRRVVRFRNTPLHEPVFTREVKAPFRETVRVNDTGRFVAVAEIIGAARPPRASSDVTVTGRAPAEFAQWDDSTLVLQPDRDRYLVGDVARIAVRAPFAGRAWVTVETDRVLSSQFVTLGGNAASVDVAVTADMHPNAFVHVHLFRPMADGEPAERSGSCVIRLRRPETELEIVTELAEEKVEPGETVRGGIVVTSQGRAAPDADVTLFAVDEAILRYGQWELPEPASVFFPSRWHEVTTHSGLRQFKPRRADEPLFQKGFLIGDGGSGWRSRYVRSRFLSLAFWQGSVRTDANGRATFAFPAPDNLTAYRIVAVAHQGAEAFGHSSRAVNVARKLQVEPALPRFARAGDEIVLRAVLRENGWPELAVNAACVVEGATLLDAPTIEKRLTKDLPQAATFRARVNADASRLRVRFTVEEAAASLARVNDAVEVEIPVRPPTVLRREAVAGEISEGWSPLVATPASWREGEGAIDVVLSSSPWLPVYAGLPSVLEYPHGCVEQVSGRVLSYALMADLLRALPDDAQRAPEYRRRVEEGLARLARAQFGEGDMPYWPGSAQVHAFATIQTAWAVVEAQRSGFQPSPGMVTRLREALTRIIRRQDRVRERAAVRAFALMVAAELELEPKPRIEALELYQQRDTLGDDGRAFLALALHRFGILPEEKRQLVAELEREPAERAFEPAIFGSTARTAALRLCARATIAAGDRSAAEREMQRRALLKLMGAAQNFSTQENLWALLAFRALTEREPAAAIDAWRLPYEGGVRSADGRAIGWYAQSLTRFTGQFSGAAALAGGKGSFLLRGVYRLTAAEARVDRGFRLERVVRNLTAPDRDGSAAAPFQIGDELAVTFRVLSERTQAYVALEESLPAAFETVDPAYYRATQREKLAFIGDVGGGGSRMNLSHWEKRDDRTLWYFDALEAGSSNHTVVVRVTSAGRFHWPGTTIGPMYDARFSGIGEGRVIEVR